MIRSKVVVKYQVKQPLPVFQRGKLLRAARAIVLFLLGVTACLISACGQDSLRSEFRSINKPSGGTIVGFAVLDDEAGDTELFASSLNDAFIRYVDDGEWLRVSTQLPDDLAHQEQYLFGGVYDVSSFAFPRHQLLVGHDDKLWAMVKQATDTESILLVRHRMSQRWQRVQLPTYPEPSPESQQPGNSEYDNLDHGDEIAGNIGDEQQQWRIVYAGMEGFFITNSRAIWRLKTRSDKSGESITEWETISLSGIPLSHAEGDSDAMVPTMLRNYLPISPSRPYETMTVLQNELMIYRRYQESDDWVLVSTAAIVDRQLVGNPFDETIYLVTGETVYRSRNEGEFWDRLDIDAQLSPGHLEALLVYPTPDSEHNQYGLLLGTSQGEILRSSDRGMTWESTYPPDADYRGISGLFYSANKERIWVTTYGNGVLVSNDGGLSFQYFNEGLEATRLLSTAKGSSDSLLVGTDAGLFRLSMRGDHYRWDKLHSHNTTSIYVDEAKNIIYSGTMGGTMVLFDEHRLTEEIKQITPPDSAYRVIYQPSSRSIKYLQPTAVMKIVMATDGSQMFAWTHHHGLWRSYDQGQTWLRLTLSPAFLSALSGAFVSNFMVDHAENMYLISRSLQDSVPSQLWRSSNHGDTWQAIFHYRETNAKGPLRVWQNTRSDDTNLFRAMGNELAYSEDFGTTWHAIDGPWDNAGIIATALDGQRAVIVSQASHSTNVFAIADIAQSTPAFVQQSLPQLHTTRLFHDNALSLIVQGRRYYLSNNELLFSGILPLRQNRLPEGMAIVFTIGLLIVVTAICFLFLKQKS